MSGPTQTVNFLPPSYITTLTTTVTSMSGSIASLQAQTTSLSGSVASLQSQAVSLSGSVGVLTVRSTVLSATASFSAVSNCTYQYLLPIKYTSPSTQVVCSLPVSPVDGDFVELIDAPVPLQGWGNTNYSCRVVAATGTVIKGDCAYFSPNATFGDLFNYRGMTVRFVYNASLATWLGSSKGNTLSKSDDPFTGWWERMNTLTSAGATMTKCMYSYFDNTRYPILWQTFEGTNKDTIMKVPTDTRTLFLFSGPTSTNPYSHTLVNIGGSAYFFSGPELVWDQNAARTVACLVGQSYDYISVGNGGINFAPYSNYTRNVGDLALWRRMTSPPNTDRNVPLDFHSIDNVGGVFINQSLYDPVYMFQKIVDQAEKMQGQLKNSYNAYSVNDYYIRQQYLEDITSTAGVSFSVPVSLVRKSHIYTGANLYPNYQAAYTGGSTRLTDICCSYTHYCTPGSNVTLSGFTGTWSNMNGYYPNGVSSFGYQHVKENAGRLDAVYNGSLSYTSLAAERNFSGSATGTALVWYNRFLLLKDTSDPSYEVEASGPYRNYGLNFGSPLAAVTHRIYKSMPLNEWIAAYLATNKYLYNYGVHMTPRTYFDNPQGRVPSAWSSLSSSLTQNLRIRSKGGEFDPLTPFIKTFYVTPYLGSTGALGQLRSLAALQGSINDPFQTTDFINNYIFGTNSTSLTDILALPVLNYCETGTVKNLYYAYAGGAPTTLAQRTFASANNLANLNNPSITGGTTIVGGLFNFRSPFTTGAYTSLYTNPSAPTGTIWALGGSNTVNFIIGKIRSDLVGGKTVMYVRMSDFSGWFGTSLGVGYKDFAPVGYTGTSDVVNNPWFGAYAASQQAFSVVGKYMNSFTGSTGGMGPDAVIFDQRANGGGSNPRELLACFGADRPDNVQESRFIDDGFSAKVTNMWESTGANAFWSPQSGATPSNRTYATPFDSLNALYRFMSFIRPSQMELNFGTNVPYIVDGISRTGASPVVKNTNVVVLADMGAGSYGEMFPQQWFGAAADRNVGNGVRANIIGDRTVGNVGYQSGVMDITRPINSLRFNLSTWNNYNYDWGTAVKFVATTGPLANQFFCEESSVYNYNNASTGANSLAGTAVNTALPHDFSSLYYDLGFLPAPGSYHIPQTRATPSLSDASTWRDAWLEQSLRQAINM